MPDIVATAPGKMILLGEHAVVYGKPAIAAPVTQVQARAVVQPALRAPSGSVRIVAPAIGLDAELADLPIDQPLALALRLTQQACGVERPPACKIKLTSTIPLAAGLGSGAAASVALIRAFSAHLGRPLPDERVCALAYEVEKLYHGTPSGVDNTVVTYARPVYFVKGKPVQTFRVGRPFTMVIGDTGIASPTSTTVGDVRTAWKANKTLYENYFEAIDSLVESARQMIENGIIEPLGPLMDANHGLLKKMGVSCAELDKLILAALRAGALGAKLSGGGRGGNMIALTSPERAERVAEALQKAGAVRTIITQVS